MGNEKKSHRECECGKMKAVNGGILVCSDSQCAEEIRRAAMRAANTNFWGQVMLLQKSPQRQGVTVNVEVADYIRQTGGSNTGMQRWNGFSFR